MQVYPLVFEPIFKPKIWGGRRLETSFGKPIPPRERIGESWELADLEDDQSVVARGPAAGEPLGKLTREWGSNLLGGADLFEGRFPLLIKFLDANETLSVQVHPDQATADRLGGRVRVKNEAWYIVDADEDGHIYRGVLEGIDAATFERAVRESRVESVLKRIPVRKGQCYYLPSGTVHALGAGVLVAEVQTPSDITYRVYDWDRVDADTGRPRELHLEQALGCISYDTGPIPGERPEHLATVWTTVTRLVRSESFVIERVRMTEGVEQPIAHEEMVIWIALEGHARVSCDGLADPMEFRAGDTVLVPAGMRNGRLVTLADTMWLEVTVPVRSDLAGFERPDRASLADSSGAAGGFVQISLPQRAFRLIEWCGSDPVSGDLTGRPWSVAPARLGS